MEHEITTPLLPFIFRPELLSALENALPSAYHFFFFQCPKIIELSSSVESSSISLISVLGT